PAYLVDRADAPERLLVVSPYGPCLSVVKVGRVSARGIQHPEPAWYTLYRIDWVEFDRLHGGEREAARPSATPARLLAGAEGRWGPNATRRRWARAGR